MACAIFTNLDVFFMEDVGYEIEKNQGTGQ